VARYDAGDRLFFWADVASGKVQRVGAALREKQVLAAATPEQRAALVKSRSADIAVLAPLQESWREQV
jgi:hypothetical protein